MKPVKANTYKVKAEFTRTMLEDLRKMHAMDYSIESLMVKRLGIILNRKSKVKRIIKMIDEISNKV